MPVLLAARGFAGHCSISIINSHCFVCSRCALGKSERDCLQSRIKNISGITCIEAVFLKLMAPQKTASQKEQNRIGCDDDA